MTTQSINPRRPLWVRLLDAAPGLSLCAFACVAALGLHDRGAPWHRYGFLLLFLAPAAFAAMRDWRRRAAST